MTDTEKLQGAQMALQVAIQQREQAQNQVIDLTVTLSLAQAEIAKLKAADVKFMDDLETRIVKDAPKEPKAK